MRKGPSFAHNRVMPGKNIVKEYVPHSFYHVYSRGVNKQPTFLSDEDYQVFLGLFKRYLSKEQPKNLSRHSYPNYSQRLELLSYALMPNHIHLLVYQVDDKAITEFMRSLMTSYSMYFNKVNKRIGPVFQSRYRASRIDQDNYLEHISRYIHLNPHEWQDFPYSSLRYFKGDVQADWIKPDKILALFPSKDDYVQFVGDYEEHKKMLDEIKWELAEP